MKKVVLLLVSLFVFMALNAVASTFEGTKEEAVTSIEKAVQDPEINAWVNKKFGSETIFLKAVKLAPEDTVKEIASTFSDFQKNGGDLETAYEASIWIYIILSIVLIAALVAA